jgi:NAD(P)-dependent dehydrogenase (short-subunit alcohol dehydrogenase family)
MSETLAGQVAVVTGASRGIGRAVAGCLARDGAQVVLLARTASALEEAVRAIETAGGVARARACDVSQPEQVEEAFRMAASWGDVKILVHCAAILERAPLTELTVSGWDRVLNVNLRGAFLCAREAYQRMVSGGGGTIVLVASLAGVAGVEKFPGSAAYTVSKFGVVGLAEALAVEGRPHRVHAIALSPGAVDTEMLRQAAPQLRAAMTPVEFAEIIRFCVGPSGAFLSGSNIPLFTNR